MTNSRQWLSEMDDNTLAEFLTLGAMVSRTVFEKVQVI